MTAKILIIDDEEGIRISFEDFLQEAGYSVSTCDGFKSGLAEIEKTEYDLVFLDIILPDGNGTDLLKHIQESQPLVPVVMITGAPSLDSAMASIHAGAFDYLVKPLRQNRLLRCASIALSQKKLKEEKEECRINFDAIFRSVNEGIITVDKTMRVVEINKSAETICGHKRRKIIGKPLDQLTHGCDGACVRTLIRAFDSRQPIDLKFVECRKENRQSQIVSVTASPLVNFANQLSGAVLTIRDETHVTNLERRLQNRGALENIVGRSPRIEKIRDQIRDLADVQTTVLLVGESGTGKELVVDALHQCGERRRGPLVKFNCAALSESLLENELFGHVAEAFTGAGKDKIGRFQLADGGTLFLDEIGDVSPQTQLRLLRVIETMEFERVGDPIPQKVDVRIIAATNQDLKQLIAAGKFRQDLYYRLKVFQIKLPPLRERLRDIPLLLEHFRREFNAKFDKNIKGISTTALNLLLNSDWPGNVRELKNIIEYAFVVCSHDILTEINFPEDFFANRCCGREETLQTEEDEVAAIREALRTAGGNKTKAAKLLGVHRKTIYRKIEKYKALL